MSLPIKDTPVLRGKDARKFIADVERNLHDPEAKKRHLESFLRAKKVYDAWTAKGVKFDFI